MIILEILSFIHFNNVKSDDNLKFREIISNIMKNSFLVYIHSKFWPLRRIF